MTSPYSNAAIETRKRQHDLRWNDDMTCWLRQTVQGHNINQDSTCSPEAHWYPGTGSEVNHGNISHCSTDALICWSFRQLLCNRGGSSCMIVWKKERVTWEQKRNDIFPGQETARAWVTLQTHHALWLGRRFCSSVGRQWRKTGIAYFIRSTGPTKPDKKYCENSAYTNMTLIAVDEGLCGCDWSMPLICTPALKLNSVNIEIFSFRWLLCPWAVSGCC